MKIPVCTIVLSKVTVEEKEKLRLEIEKEGVKVQSSQERVLGVDDAVELVALLSGTGVLIEQGIKLSKAIIKWRRERRNRGEIIDGSLDNPHSTRLNLATATDEEIERWIEERVQCLFQK